MGSKRYTYEIYTKDLATGQFKKVSQAGQNAYNKLVSGQTRFNKKVRSGSTGVTQFTGNLKRMVASYVGLGSVIWAARDSLKKWDTQAQADAQVMQGLISTNNAAGRSFETLKKQASEFQKKSLFGDEDILQNVTAQFLTFTNIVGVSFDKAQQAALDVTTRLYGSAASAESLRSTSIMLGKALNDPVANLGALSRSGIQFSEVQKNLIKRLWQTGDTATAQMLILQELQQQYGGSAAAAANVGLGPWRQFLNTIGDIQERIGPFLNKILQGLMAVFDWMQRNSTMVTLLGSLIISTVIAYKAWTVAQLALNLAMSANPIGIVITLIGALVGALIWAVSRFDKVKQVVWGLWAAFKAVFTNIGKLVKNIMGGVADIILGVLGFDGALIKQGVKKIGGAFANNFMAVGKAAQAGAAKAISDKAKAPTAMSGIVPQTTMSPTGANISGDVQEGVTNITAGGKKQTNISISIDKMIETFTVTPDSSETWPDIEEKILDTLMRVINSANRFSVT